MIRSGVRPTCARAALASVVAFITPAACGRVGYDLLPEQTSGDGGGAPSTEAGIGGASGVSGGGVGAGGARGGAAGSLCGLSCGGASGRDAAADVSGGATGIGGSGGSAGAATDAGRADAATPEDAGADAAPTGCVLGATQYAVGGVASLSGTVAITGAASGKCVTLGACAESRGVKLIQTGCTFDACQLWEPISLGGGWYALRNAATGHCLDVADNYVVSTNLVQWDCWLPQSQNVQAVCAAGGEWRLVARASSDVLGIAGGLTSDGANVSHGADSGGQSQRFRLDTRSDVFSPIVPTGETPGGAPFRFTTASVPAGWTGVVFDDSSWASGPGGFGSGVGSTVVARTSWATADIWLRKSFTITGAVPAALSLRLSHDEDVEVYLNGVLAFSAPSWETGYRQAPVSAAGRAALTSGTNVLAVHCRSTSSPQFIDVGLGVYAWKP